MKKIKRFVLVVVALCVVALVVVVITNSNVRAKTDSVIFTELKDVPRTKVAIIFGAGINGDQPSRYLKDRLDAGISLYKNHKVDKILLSGDNGRDEYDELSVMKLYCQKNGIDTAKIYIDYAGFDSYSTMYRAKYIFNVDTAILVSQKYHLNRCVYLGDKLGIKSFGYSADRGAYPGYKYYAFREKLSVTKAVLDVMRNRKPKHLGKQVDVNGKSNYTKE
ncbi:YdcF family protein [Sphingobacterium siyangense]|uniref:SanA/YdcF family protein n=1 Tax=Sphingobacterium siyangense TaxID=459529 RepID=UPI00200E2ADD|nr:ElyC/SanA/YdcF family protein [Sphingobacterium siyangense]UQA77397.1 YdcF family protein [Sphingobacterium siyangense]